jgi:hypothetical protein
MRRFPSSILFMRYENNTSLIKREEKEKIVPVLHFRPLVHDLSFSYLINNNNNNQAFYSQASWGRLELKPHEKKGTKQERKRREKQRAIKKTKSKKEKRQ